MEQIIETTIRAIAQAWGTYPDAWPMLGTPAWTDDDVVRFVLEDGAWRLERQARNGTWFRAIARDIDESELVGN